MMAPPGLGGLSALNQSPLFRTLGAFNPLSAFAQQQQAQALGQTGTPSAVNPALLSAGTAQGTPSPPMLNNNNNTNVGAPPVTMTPPPAGPNAGVPNTNSNSPAFGQGPNGNPNGGPSQSPMTWQQLNHLWSTLAAAHSNPLSMLGGMFGQRPQMPQPSPGLLAPPAQSGASGHAGRCFRLRRGWWRR